MTKTLLVFAAFFVMALYSFGQTCPANSDRNTPYTWPTHTNWFFGEGNNLSFGATGTGSPTVSSLPTAGVWANGSYESTASASDEDGNLLFYTNGTSLFDAAGTEILAGMLTGDEQGNQRGSAVQGVMIVKHPLDINNYYIFTTDDALTTTQGFNYYVYNKLTNSATGPNRIGTYRSTEQIDATWHANGVDVWITTHRSGTGDLYTYLLSCAGLSATPVVSSDMALVATSRTDNDRSCFKFSWDGTMAATSAQLGGGNWDPPNTITIMDFNDTTGVFSNVKRAGNGVSTNPYNLEWGTDNSTIIFSEVATGNVFTVNAKAGNAAAIAGSKSNIASSTTAGRIKLGGDGVFYFSRFGGGSNLSSISGGTYTANAITVPNIVQLSLPDMFIPPRDWLEIQDPGALTECNLPYDFTTLWLCKKDTAENTPLYENAYSVISGGNGATINPVTGVFNANAAGTYKIEFSICTIKDTLEFTVGTCGCSAKVKPGPLSFCVGTNLMLDTLLESASGAGTWDLDSVPTSVPGTNLATINHGLSDTIFTTTTNTRPGTYKLMFTVTGGVCEDSIYVTVNPIPRASIASVGPFCRNDAAVNLTGSPNNGADTTGVWEINGTVNAAGSFDPAAVNIGNNTVRYMATVKSCADTADSVFVVNALPVPSIATIGPFCSDDVAVSLTGTPTIGADTTAVWKINGVVNAAGSFDPAAVNIGNNTVRYISTVNNCVDSVDSVFVVNAVPVASIISIGPFCNDDAAVNLTGVPADGADTTGVWKINGIVNGAGSFDPAAVNIGNNTVRYIATVNNCVDSVDSVFVVNAVPVASIASIGPFCDYDAAVNLTGFPANGADTTGVWKINGTVNAAGSFDPAAVTVGNNTVRYIATVKNCVDSVDSVFIVYPKPIVSVNDSTVCDGVSALFTATANATISTHEWGINGSNGSGASSSASGTAAGAYTVAVEDVNGCRDTATGNLTVNPLKDATITTGTSSDTIRLCALEPIDPTVTVAQGGGTWDNPNVSLTGTTATIDLSGIGSVTNLRLIYSLEDPCKDSDTIWITTTNKLDATITPMGPFCASRTDSISLLGQDGPGAWVINGAVQTLSKYTPEGLGAGTHIIYHQIGGACGDTDTVSAVVFPLAVADITGDAVLCRYDNAITLSADSTNGTWREIGGKAGFNTTTLGFDPLTAEAGVHQIEHSVSNAECADIDTAWVTVIDTPVFTINPVTDVCTDAAAFDMGITPSVADSGVWSGTGLTGKSFNPVTAGVGTHTLTYTVGAVGCQKVVTIDVTVLPLANAELPGDVAICRSVGLYDIDPTVDVGGPGTFTATCGSCINATTGVFDPLLANAGTNTVTYTIGGACGDNASMVVTVDDVATLNLTSPDDVCYKQGLTAQFTANAGGTAGTGTWTKVSGPGTISTDGMWTAPTTEQGGTFVASYTFTTAGTNCPSDASVSFEIFDAPNVAFTRMNEDSCVAFGEVFTDVSDYSSVPTATLLESTWDFGNGLTSTDKGSVATNYTVPGTYTVSLFNLYDNNCRDTATMEVKVFPIPTADFTSTPNPASVLDPKVEFVSTGDFADLYKWDFTSQGTPDSTIGLYPTANTVFEVEGDDTIPVTLIISQNNYPTNVGNTVACTDTVTKNVIIQDIFQLYIPNAFTPSGRPDGLNDTFYPLGRNWDTDDYEFVVLDRWGNLIFETTTIGVGWDGTVDGSLSSGKLAQNDVYVWKLTVKDKYTGKKHKRVGTVTIVR